MRRTLNFNEEVGSRGLRQVFRQHPTLLNQLSEISPVFAKFKVTLPINEAVAISYHRAARQSCLNCNFLTVGQLDEDPHFLLNTCSHLAKDGESCGKWQSRRLFDALAAAAEEDAELS